MLAARLSPCILALVGCDPRQVAGLGAGGGERSRDTLIVGRAGDVMGLDPARFSDNESVEVCEQIYEHLVRYRRDSLEVEPALATSWEVSADGTEWTFNLRRGVWFHDGTAFDAQAVVFSLGRQLTRERSDFLYWETSFQPIVKDVWADGSHRIKIRIHRPYAPFLTALAMFPVSIVSPVAQDLARYPVGTGPYRFVSWTDGDRVVLERNERYWGQRPRVRRLVFRKISNARQRLVALQSETVDVATAIAPEDLQFVELHPDLLLHRAAGQNVAYVAMNTLRPPWNDVRVRRAVNHAVNKEAIVGLVYQGLAVPARGPLPPSLWSYREDVATYAYDPGRAQVLLAEARAAGAFDPDATFKLYVPLTPRAYLPDPEQVGRVLRRNLEQVGIKTELVLQDLGAHLRSGERGEHDLCLLGWAGDMGDPDNFLYLLFSRDNAVVGRARNVAFYGSEAVHELLARAQAESDRSRREADYREAQGIIAAEAPWVPLAHSQIAVAAHRRVKGLTIHPSAIVAYQHVWLAQ